MERPSTPAPHGETINTAHMERPSTPPTWRDHQHRPHGERLSTSAPHGETINTAHIERPPTQSTPPTWSDTAVWSCEAGPWALVMRPLGSGREAPWSLVMRPLGSGREAPGLWSPAGRAPGCQGLMKTTPVTRVWLRGQV
ncbi:unnamed protein product [Gadus morhua 'NCC']